MASSPTTMLAPAVLAYPKFAGVLNALAAIIAADSSAPPTSGPPAQTPPANPAAQTIHSGQFLMLNGGDSIGAFDFGDPWRRLIVCVATTPHMSMMFLVVSPPPRPSPASPSARTAITVVADPRPQITLAPGADLAAALSKITAPSILLLPAGSSFDVTNPATIAVDGITLRAAGTGAAPRIRRITAAGIYSTLIVTASNVSIEGIEFDSDKPLLPANNVKVGVYSINVQGKNLLVRNCTFRNVDDALHCNPQASGLVVVNCNFTNELRGCAIYTDAMPEIVVLGMTAVGSVCEHIIRLEGAVNVLIHGGDFNNHDGKETIAIRKAGCVAVTGNVMRCWRASARRCRISREPTARKSSSPAIISPACVPTAPGCRSIPAF